VIKTKAPQTRLSHEALSTFSRVADGWRFNVQESVLSCSQIPTASTMMNRSFDRALGETTLNLSGEMTRTPRPFICSKNPADFTEKINAVLTPDQQSKWKQMKQEMMEKHKEMKSQGQADHQ
jgi:hypothetical protein